MSRVSAVLVGVAISVCAAGFSHAGVSVAAASPARAAQPNVVVIIADDQRWDTLSVMPTVSSRLVSRGVTFRNAFTVNPLCCPSRVSFLTGQYSHTSGVWTNTPPDGGFDGFEGEGSTLATWLDDAGYQTALIGKYLNGYARRDVDHVPPGWDRWVAFAPPGYFDYHLSIDGTAEFHGDATSEYGTDVIAGYAGDFIRATPNGRPLFLWFAPLAPHAPAIPAPRHAGAFDGIKRWRPPSYDEADVSDKPLSIQERPRITTAKATGLDSYRENQLASLLALDDAVAQLLDALKDTGRLSDTMIVYVSDNGFLWGEHRWKGKRVPYEESIRLPFVVRWDRLGRSADRVRQMVLSIDLAPTVARIAGVDAPSMDGSSLLPLLQGTSVDWRTGALIETGGAASDVPPYCAFRERSSIFVHYATDEEEYYDLRSDRYQLTNLVGAPELQEEIARLRNSARQLCSPLPPGMARF